VSIGFSFKKKNQYTEKTFRFLLEKRKLGKENRYGGGVYCHRRCSMRPAMIF